MHDLLTHRQVIKDVVVKAMGFKYHRHCVLCAHRGAKLVPEGSEATIRIDETGNACCDACYNKKKQTTEEQQGPADQQATSIVPVGELRGGGLFGDFVVLLLL